MNRSRTKAADVLQCDCHSPGSAPPPDRVFLFCETNLVCANPFRCIPTIAPLPTDADEKARFTAMLWGTANGNVHEAYTSVK